MAELNNKKKVFRTFSDRMYKIQNAWFWFNFKQENIQQMLTLKGLQPVNDLLINFLLWNNCLTTSYILWSYCNVTPWLTFNALKSSVPLIRFWYIWSPPRYVWIWSGFSISSPILHWAPWLCWTSSLDSLLPSRVSWNSQTLMTPVQRKRSVRQRLTAPSSFHTEISHCPARLRECVKAWMRRWTFTMPTGKKKKRKSDRFNTW